MECFDRHSVGYTLLPTVRQVDAYNIIAVRKARLESWLRQKKFSNEGHVQV